MISNNNYEQKIVSDFLNHAQSTHNNIVSNSVGMAILKLKKDYHGDTVTDEMLEHSYEICVKELKEIQDEFIKPSIDHIIAVTKEKIITELDTLTLYIPTESLMPDEKGQMEKTLEYADEKFVIPLSVVLPLVWKALHDNAKYTHHYQGTEAEKINQASADLPRRLESFYLCLQRIKNDTICHHGGRNELIFNLNKSYAGIDLIEDARGTVLALLKDNLNANFWKVYSDTNTGKEAQQQLTAALYKWIGQDNPHDVITLVGNQSLVRDNILNLFITHGTNPETILLDNIINEALPALNFTISEPKKYPHLARIQKILNILPADGQENRNAAIAFIQNWIQTYCELDNLEHNKILAAFYHIYKFTLDFNQYHYILQIAEKLDQRYVDLMTFTDEYFSAVKEGNFIEVNVDKFTAIQALSRTINESKNNKMVDEITNFFAHYVNAYIGSYINEPHLLYDNLKSVYKLFCDENFHSKVILKDDELKNIFLPEAMATTDLNFKYITPYHINRLFLHALIILPSAWSELFMQIFPEVLRFVEGKFNQEQTNTAQSLYKSSYPFLVTGELDYLRRIGLAHNVRQDRDLFLPQHWNTLDEWVHLSCLLDAQSHIFYYEQQKVKIDQLVWTYVININPSSYHSLNPAAIISIPNSKKLNFFKTHVSILQIWGWRGLFFVLDVLDITDRMTYLTEVELFIDIKKHFSNNSPGLREILKRLPVADRTKFLLDYIIGKSLIRKNTNILKIILGEFSDKERLDILMDKLEIEFLINDIDDSNITDVFASVQDANKKLLPRATEFTLRLMEGLMPHLIWSFLPADHFMTFLQNNSFKKLFCDYYVSDNRALKMVAIESRLDFLKDNFGIEWIKNNIGRQPWHLSKLLELIEMLHDGDKFSFIVDDLGIDYIKQLTQFGVSFNIYPILKQFNNHLQIIGLINIFLGGIENIHNYLMVILIFSKIKSEDKFKVMFDEKWFAIIARLFVDVKKFEKLKAVFADACTIRFDFDFLIKNIRTPADFMILCEFNPNRLSGPNDYINLFGADFMYSLSKNPADTYLIILNINLKNQYGHEKLKYLERDIPIVQLKTMLYRKKLALFQILDILDTVRDKTQFITELLGKEFVNWILNTPELQLELIKKFENEYSATAMDFILLYYSPRELMQKPKAFLDAVLALFNLYNQEKLQKYIALGAAVTCQEIMPTWRPSTFTLFFHPVASGLASGVYSSCLAAESDATRYHILDCYMNNPANKDSYYHQVLINKFGPHFFAPKVNVSSVVFRTLINATTTFFKHAPGTESNRRLQDQYMQPLIEDRHLSDSKNEPLIEVGLLREESRNSF